MGSLFSTLTKRSGKRNVSNAAAHSSRVGHDLTAAPQHHPGRIRLQNPFTLALLQLHQIDFLFTTKLTLIWFIKDLTSLRIG